MNNIKDDFTMKCKNRKRDEFLNSTKEERAKALDNVICPRCKYQNHRALIKKYGKCNLCGTTLDKDYFKKTLLNKLNSGRK